MIIRIVKLTFKPEHIAAFQTIFENSCEQIRAQQGCLGLRLLQDKHRPEIFFTYSHWESEEDLNRYRHSELFGQVWPATKKLFGDRPDAWTVNQLAEL
jgi:quinol monooxygenase YgiN